MNYREYAIELSLAVVTLVAKCYYRFYAATHTFSLHYLVTSPAK